VVACFLIGLGVVLSRCFCLCGGCCLLWWVVLPCFVVFTLLDGWFVGMWCGSFGVGASCACVYICVYFVLGCVLVGCFVWVLGVVCAFYILVPVLFLVGLGWFVVFHSDLWAGLVFCL